MTVVAVTGGARGIGRAIAERFRAGGARVAIGDVDKNLASVTAAEIGGVSGMWVDVADPAAFEAFVSEVEQAHGGVDILVNNAGIMPIGAFLDQDPAVAKRAVDVNVHGVLNGIRAVLPGMLRRGSGHIVNIASIAGKVGVAGGVVYSASKHAVVGAGDAVRAEYGSRGIRVTTVLPSFTNTELISGTTGLRGIGTVEPAAVADAVAKAVRRNRTTAYVPGLVRASAWLHETLPATANDALARAVGADRVFLDVDRSHRQGYDARITESPE